MFDVAGFSDAASVTFQSQDRIAAKLRFAAGAIGGFIVFIAVTVLISWTFDAMHIKGYVPGWHTMKPNTAICFLCIGIAILAEGRSSGRRYADWTRTMCAGLAALIGALCLVQHLTGVDFGIDELFFQDHHASKSTRFPGRMAAATASGFIFLGIALGMLKAPRFAWLVQVCAIAAGLMAILSILGYIIGASSVYAINLLRSVAFHTAWLFLIAAAATLLFLPTRGLLGILTSPGAGGQMARRLFPVVFSIPLIIGWLRIVIHNAGLIDVPFGIALVACCNLLLVTAAVYWCARSLEKTDTRRKRTEASFRRVVESAPNAMVIVDRDGRIAMVNNQLEKLFEFPQTRLLGHSIELLVPDHMRDHHSRRRAEFLAAPVKRPMSTTRELFGRRRNGSQFPVEIGLTPVDFEGELMVVCTVVDLTQRRLAEQRDRDRLAELAHVGRLSTVGEMISGLAHEINQPLAAACNYARACARFARSESGATVEQIAELVDKTLAQTERANQIVSRMCAFVRKGTPTRSAVDVNEVVRDVISLTIPSAWLRNAVPDRVAVRVDSDKSLPTVWADRVQIEQVLVNLVRNAIDAMQSRDSDARQLEITTSLIQDGVTVTVADSGPGVAPEHAPCVFDPFFTTKSDGIGLGLSLSRSIIEAHNGRLWHEPGPGGGARFVFSLPLANAKEAAA